MAQMSRDSPKPGARGSVEVSNMGATAQALGVSFTALPSTLAESCIRGGAAAFQTSTAI